MHIHTVRNWCLVHSEKLVFGIIQSKQVLVCILAKYLKLDSGQSVANESVDEIFADK